MITYTQKCYSQSMGLWLINESFAERFMSVLKAGLLNQGELSPVRAESDRLYDTFGKWAIVPIVGQTSKGGDSFGGGSTVEARKGIRNAEADGFENLLVYLDTPGGHVFGTHELAMDLRRAGERMNTHAHIQDEGTSAGFYIASQAHRISANRPANIGNVGVVGAVIDSSAAADIQGIKVHLLSTGKYKGIGVPGTPVTEEQVAHLQTLIDDTFGLFTEAVQTGRNLSPEQLEQVLTGAIFNASDALDIGLIDEIGDFQEIMEGLNMDEEKLAQAMVKAMGVAGVFQVAQSASAENVEPPEAPDVVEPVAASASAPDYAAAPVKEVIEAEATVQAAAQPVSASYEEGVAAGRQEALAIVKQAAVLNLGAAEACQAIESGMSADSYRDSLYAARTAGDSPEINSAGPVQTQIPRHQQHSAASGPIRISRNEAYDARKKLQNVGA